MEKIKGYIDYIIHQNPINGYTVAVIIQSGKEITVVGSCRDISLGETIEAEGEYVQNPTYGKQFKIASYRVVPPADKDSIERYLGSGAVKGVGQALAARIVKAFGEDSLRIIEEEPERLAEIKGISMRRAMEIAVQFEEKRDLRDAMLYLGQYGITQALSIKIYDTYGQSLYAVMKENPYRLAEDIQRVGFITADNIARKMGVPEDSPNRIRCGILYTLTQAAGDGHCYLPLNELIEKSAQMLAAPAESVQNEINGLVIDSKIIIRDDNAYDKTFFYAENTSARLLKELDLPLEKFDGNEEEIFMGRLKSIAKEQGMEVDSLQLEAVKESVKRGVFILSGGPGTGKTTTINLMISYYLPKGMDIMLAAPTGRAAKRMSEATGYEAVTIHRLLEFGGSADDDESGMFFQKNEDNPLEADVVIIDEVSMVDILLFRALLKAIIPGTRLILVGDASQLPSVGPGQVLRDLIECKAFSCMKLQKIFRQAAGSDIIVNAHKINSGEQIRLDTNSKDFLFLERNNETTIKEIMVWMIKEKLPTYCNADMFDIQVLTPMRKGALGCIELNRYLQGCLNPAAPDKREHMTGDYLFREGDKVMQIKNNYKLEWEIFGKYGIVADAGLGVFNGDTGRIIEINEAASELIVEFDDKKTVSYPFNALDELEPAYAITIHKAQGSEYPAVILPMLDFSPLMRYRNLLYTGITRGKSCVVILGSSNLVRQMIDNEGENRRYSTLAKRIEECI